MKTVGLIVEYNPFHNGHLHHFTAAKAAVGADACVAVMSGNFLQRGEPAIVSKWARAEMALSVGIDLVIELPVPFACANAEIFAHGAVSILDRLGVVDFLCFGSESGELEWMRLLAKTLADEPAAFTRYLKAGLAEGLAYPVAYAAAAGQLMQDMGFGRIPIDQPNNILGLNYLLALERQSSPIQAATIKRQKAGYHQETITDSRIASATAIRKLIFDAKGALQELASFVPPSVLEILSREFASGAGPVSWEHFRHPLFHRLLQLTPEELSRHHEIEEGVEYRLKQAVKRVETVRELLSQAKTRRFTWNRLQRMLLSVLLGLGKDDIARFQLKAGAPYARVLGFNETGQALLHRAKQSGRLPIYTKVRDGIHPMLDLDIVADSLYRLALPNPGKLPFTREYRQAPIRRVSAAAP
ncbi:nucleotidyltransferase [Brevibacillus massiliensis]|uniref:nucleotidyltransferase n=1 Tax=Brevibacillus massiliensis TaxID=1118054 RepID=UPI00036B2309|nr:nucleotidyltransferase [Brevibacillus massiliensis]